MLAVEVILEISEHDTMIEKSISKFNDNFNYLLYNLKTLGMRLDTSYLKLFVRICMNVLYEIYLVIV